MMSEGTRPVLRLLDEIRTAVVGGDLGLLADLSARLAREVETLEGDPALARAIRARAERNLMCLDAASRGVRAAQRRLDEIRKAASGTVTTYDGAGRRSEATPEAMPRQRL